MNAPEARIYLDHNATTPVDPRVLEAMLPWFSERFGNAASATHDHGSEAAAAVETARYAVARLIGAEDKDIIFTSGATESINLALQGVAGFDGGARRHLVTVASEHRAVLDTCAHLAASGRELTTLPVDGHGLLAPQALAAALRPDTLLVSCMHANNEIGTIHDISALGALCRRNGTLLHVDAAQSLGKEPIDVETMGIDLLSASAHKLYGPKGVGALYVRRRGPRVRLAPLMHGGGHERGWRPGTLNVPGIVGFGRACELASDLMDEERARLRALKERLWQALSAGITGLIRLGHPERCLAGTLALVVPGIDAKRLLCALPGLAAAIGAACTSIAPKPSHVLRAIGLDWRQAEGALRLSLGRGTSAAEVDAAAARIVAGVAALHSPSAQSSRH